jgi:transcriptional regulator with XRE-family HTH domain
MQGITEGHKKLRAWLEAEGRSQSALGRKLGVSQTAVALWVKPGHRPSYLHRAALEKLGVCPATDWETKAERKKREELESLGGAA